MRVLTRFAHRLGKAARLDSKADQKLSDFRNRDDFPLAVKAAFEWAEHATRDPHEVDDDFWSEPRQFYDEGEIIELRAAIGLFNYFNRFNDTPHGADRLGEVCLTANSIAAAHG